MELARRAWIGVRLESVGLRVAAVAPGSMAAAAGIAAGDELTSIDGKAVATFDDLICAARRCAAETVVELGFRRGDRALGARVAVVPQAREPGVSYEHVEVARDVRLRLLVSEPEATTAILFLPGLGLDSLERPRSESLLGALIRGCSEAGVATARLERRGIGDSEGGDPGAVDFATEVTDLAKTLEALGGRFETVALFGHSLGGMIAPLLAGAARALVVYGTSADRWFECCDASARRQLRGRGANEAVIESRIAAMRHLRDRGESDDERCFAFHEQLDSTDIAGAWRRVSVPVLAMWGERDEVVSSAECSAIGRELAAADVEFIDGVDHMGAPAPERIVRSALAWMHKQALC